MLNATTAQDRRKQFLDQKKMTEEDFAARQSPDANVPQRIPPSDQSIIGVPTPPPEYRTNAEMAADKGSQPAPVPAAAEPATGGAKAPSLRNAESSPSPENASPSGVSAESRSEAIRNATSNAELNAAESLPVDPFAETK